MRICIDARSLRDHMTGLGRYAAHLVYYLTDLDRTNQYIILRQPSSRGPIAVGPHVTEVEIACDISSVRSAVSAARTIDGLRPDLYHALFHFLPLGLRTRPVVVTLHDLIWVNHVDVADGRWWRRWVKGSIGHLGVRHAVYSADHVIAISDSTRHAATSTWDVPDTKFSTIHHGVDGPVSPASPNDAPGQSGFIFALGNGLPYKNLPRLIEAFALIAGRYPDVQLSLAGRGESQTRLTRLVARLGLAGRVSFEGILSDYEIQRLLETALFFAFPSVVEGFGMPVLEAMASGCPVLTARSAALAEVAGDAALLIDPLDVADIARGMERLLTDPGLRQRLAARGAGRAKGYSWESCAQATLDVYHHVTDSAHLTRPLARC